MSSDRISPEDAENDLSCNIYGVKCSVKDYIEYVLQIHCGLLRSHNKWLDTAKKNAKLDLARAEDRVSELKDALALLARIDREDE